MTDDLDTLPQPIHLGFRLGINPLTRYLKAIQEIGVNHLALDLRFNHGNSELTLQ